MKRGQISLFIILGIVLLIIFVFMFQLSSHKGVDVEKTYTDIISATPIREYTNLCLDRSVKEGLRLVGLQGGNIYQHQANGTTKAFGKPYPEPPPTACASPPCKSYVDIPYGWYSLPFKTHGTWYIVPVALKDRLPQKQPFFAEPNYPYVDLSNPSIPRNASLLMDPDKLMPSPCVSGFECPFRNPFAFSQISAFFGSYGTLLPLCDRFTGSNMQNSPALQNSCETYNSDAGPSQLSTQQFLEKYIKNQTEECLNLSSSLEKLFPGYAVKVESSVVSVTIGDDDVVTYLTLPLTINISGNPVTKQLNFYNKKNVRLKLIHELATRIIRNNSMSIFFAPEDDYYKLNDCRNLSANIQVQCAKDGMSVTRYRDVCLGNDPNTGEPTCPDLHSMMADIINITDTKSDIDGKPYSFLFGIENRRPALDFIHETGDQDVNKLGDTYDIIVFQGDVINFTPFGYDPDKDNYEHSEGGINYPYCKNVSFGETRNCMNYKYGYSGWKADYEQEFDYQTDPMGVEKIVGVWLKENPAPWEIASKPASAYQPFNTSSFDYSFDPDNPDTATNPNIIHRFLDGMGLAPGKNYTCLYDTSLRGCNSIVNQWETSSEFSTPGAEGYKRIANYKTNRTDVGPHIVNVSVWDTEGLADYQLVRILVYKVKGPGDPGLPPPGLGGTGKFLSPAIKNNYASIEDPYTLWINDPDAQIAPDVGPATQFQWIDLVEGNPFPLPNIPATLGAMPKAMIKLPESFGTYDIKNPFKSSANPYMFSVTDNGNPGNPHKHIVNLSTTNPKHGPTWDVYVYECLPYRSTISPYPYNNFAGDPAGYDTGAPEYATNHVCCWGDTTAPGTDTMWGTIKKPSNAPCYTYSVDSCGPPDLISSQTPTGAIPPANLALKDYGNTLWPYMPVITPTCIGSCTEANAIYTRTFSQDCGNRGNACSGTASDTWFIKYSCNSIQPGEHESCQGAFQTGADYDNCKDDVRNGISVTVPSSCFNYDHGHSWEEEIGGGDGICNDVWRCTDSPNTAGGYAASSTYYALYRCQAQCDGSGGCTYSAPCEDCSTMGGVFGLCLDDPGGATCV